MTLAPRTRLLGPPPPSPLAPRASRPQAYITTQNTIWIFVAAAVVYGIGASLLGEAARIPLVADAAEQQVR